MAGTRWWLLSFVVVAVAATMGGLLQNQAAIEFLLGQMVGGSKATAAHNDGSRSAVGWTAFFVALCRAGESKVAASDALFRDPVAERMFALWDGSAPFSARLSLTFFPIVSKMKWMQRTAPLVSLRTLFFDEQIQESLRRQKKSDKRPYEQQLVVLGTGLDSRVFRLNSLLNETNTRAFELDFPGMLAEKRRLFGSIGYSYTNDSIPATHIGVDLTTDEWDSMLKSRGFDPSLPTLWLVEGLFPYLKETEMEDLLERLSRLSAPSSRLLGTWLTESKTDMRLAMHQSFVADPTKFLSSFDFTKEIQVKTLNDIAERIDRFRGNKQLKDDYLMTCHEKPGVVSEGILS